ARRRFARERGLVDARGVDQPRDLVRTDLLGAAARARGELQAAADRRELDGLDPCTRRVLLHCGNKWVDEDGAGLVGAADQADRELGAVDAEAGVREDGEDLPGELSRPARVELTGDGIAGVGKSAGLGRERSDLALCQRLGVDAGGERLDARSVEELDDRVAQRRWRSETVAVGERSADRGDAEPVAAALVAEQVPPTA